MVEIGVSAWSCVCDCGLRRDTFFVSACARGGVRKGKAYSDIDMKNTCKAKTGSGGGVALRVLGCRLPPQPQVLQAWSASCAPLCDKLFMQMALCSKLSV